MRTILMTTVLLLGMRAAEPARIGDAAPKMTLTDIRSLPRTLDDFETDKPIVLAFVNATCAVTQKLLPDLKALSKAHPEVQFALVNPCEDDDLIKMATHAVKQDLPFPCLKDFHASAANSLGIRRVGGAVVFDGKKRLRFRGRIEDLKDVLPAVVAGKEITIKELASEGMVIRQPAEPVVKTVNFAEHVAPILKSHCWSCHSSGGSAPFSLTTHEQASKRANAILETVTDQRMPPWFASHEFGPFVNKRGLTETEKATLRDWVVGGKLPGDLAKAPAEPRKQPSTWQIGDPDLIVETMPITLPAKGDIPYQYTILPYVFTHDTWVQCVQILPDNPRSLHHCTMAFVKLTEQFKESNFITGYVPGGEPVMLDPGLASLIPAGSVLALQMHFVSTGKPETCTVRVGFRYPRAVVDHQLHNIELSTKEINIPPGASHHRIADSRMLEHDAVGVGLFAHMHLRGKDMSFIAHLPAGQSETLLIVPNFNFDWQIPYRWQTGKKVIPKGTRLECIAHYDNSRFNPYNPDPKATVRYGLQTHDEMMLGYFYYTRANEKLNLTIDPKNGRVIKK